MILVLCLKGEKHNFLYAPFARVEGVSFTKEEGGYITIPQKYMYFSKEAQSQGAERKQMVRDMHNIEESIALPQILFLNFVF
jgi:hypothetical protein